MNRREDSLEATQTERYEQPAVIIIVPSVGYPCGPISSALALDEAMPSSSSHLPCETPSPPGDSSWIFFFFLEEGPLLLRLRLPGYAMVAA